MEKFPAKCTHCSNAPVVVVINFQSDIEALCNDHYTPGTHIIDEDEKLVDGIE